MLITCHCYPVWLDEIKMPYHADALSDMARWMRTISSLPTATTSARWHCSFMRPICNGSVRRVSCETHQTACPESSHALRPVSLMQNSIACCSFNALGHQMHWTFTVRWINGNVSDRRIMAPAPFRGSRRFGVSFLAVWVNGFNRQRGGIPACCARNMRWCVHARQVPFNVREFSRWSVDGTLALLIASIEVKVMVSDARINPHLRFRASTGIEESNRILSPCSRSLSLLCSSGTSRVAQAISSLAFSGRLSWLRSDIPLQSVRPRLRLHFET